MPRTDAKAPSFRLKRWLVLEALVIRHGWTKGAEIGVLNGATFFHLLDNCLNLSMIAVDSWGENAPDYGDLTQVGREFVRKAEGYGERARVLLGRSVDMARHVEDASLNFVFIDADHSYDAVSADIAAWAPKVRKGGAIMGHDIDHEDVCKAVTEFFGAKRVIVLPDDVWAVES
jgi:predicted O-methyltransferase YrrM